MPAIYVRDGSYWTSAGVTAGIDLALAVVEQDFGHALALDVARDLVMYLKRGCDQLAVGGALWRPWRAGGPAMGAGPPGQKCARFETRRSRSEFILSL
jgi:hypothetical protein